MPDQNVQEHLVVSIIIDNSYVAESQTFCDALKTLVSGLGSYHQSHAHKSRFHLSITGFGGLSPHVIKSFNEDSLEIPQCQGFPLMDKTMSFVLADMQSQIKTLKSQNHELYKPWLVVLSSGLSYDALSVLSQDHALQLMSQLTLFPFLLDDKFLSSQVTALNRLKPFMVIKDHQINALYQWLTMMLDQRISQTSDVKMRLEKDMLKDWIYL
jgi:uncharacterized protein YegL